MEALSAPNDLLTTLTALLLITAASSLSVVFALAESSLFSLSPWQTNRLAEQSPRLEPFLDQLRSKPEDLLATLVLGNTLMHAAIGGVAVLMVLRGTWPAGATLAGVGFLLLMGCEVVPKTIAGRRPERFAKSLLKPTAILQPFLRPVHQIAQRVNDHILSALIPSSLKPQTQPTDEDYQELVELGAQTGSLDEEEKEIILEIISLDQKSVGEIMTPRTQLATVAFHDPTSTLLEAAIKARHTRLLLQNDDTQQIVGVLNAQNLILNPDGDIDSLMEMPTYIPESMNLWNLFISFQKQRQRLAVVLDEYGETAGVVTVEDILEEIMGPLFDSPTHEPARIEPLAPGRWRVHGLTSITDFAKEAPRIGSVSEIDTMGGLVATLIGYIPQRAMSVDYHGLRFTIQKLGPRLIEELIVEELPSGLPKG